MKIKSILCVSDLIYSVVFTGLLGHKFFRGFSSDLRACNVDKGHRIRLKLFNYSGSVKTLVRKLSCVNG